ncbi:4-alpha-glucanotransferase [Haloferula chungangensis]|uniref:4-alpha-glucanotransferase n=1 Tax=Haloferula chungangensis TaxID=1048331 RepID=A0ABW2L2R1_9BACT
MLAPVYALRHQHDLGIGDTRAVREAIDFCVRHGIEVLQLLPIHETFGDHSPYNPISSRAHSPALISLSPESVPGLTREMVERAAPADWVAQLRKGNVRNEVVHPLKNQILINAYFRFQEHGSKEELAEFDRFQEDQYQWLAPYTLFRLLLRQYEGNTQWSDWRPENQSWSAAEDWLLRHPAREDLERLRRGFAFIQWVSWRQWKELKAYADQQGVRLMGEMSFGVGKNSADVWAEPSLFDLEWSIGTRPLAHFDTTPESESWGQNWGFPPYRWENHRSSSFAWLRGRIAWEAEFFHGCRLDHLRGYFRVYMFPWDGGARHAEFANLSEAEALERTGGRLPRFVPGPDEDPAAAAINEVQGREIIGHLIDAAGDMDLVAEIMGDMPEYMSRTLEDLKLANLSFPQLLRRPDGEIIEAEAFRELSLVTYANHDNAPLSLLYLHLLEASRKDPGGPEASDLKALRKFAGLENAPPPEHLDDEYLEAFQKALFGTSARLAVLMCSDLLGLPLRFNLPGSYGRGTWSDRLDLPLSEYESHPKYGPRIERVSRLVRESGRH